MRDNAELSVESTKYLLEKILKNIIIEIRIEGVEHFDSIVEYDFSLIKANIVYSDNKEDELYIRIIKGGKIKESIFCFWSCLYEDYIKNKNDKFENTVQKALITQIASEENISNILLTIDSKLNYCAEITLVELKNYFEKKENGERWVEDLEIKDNDILFIAKKMY